MNIGDRVAHVNLMGTIVGVASSGQPIVEWFDGEFTAEDSASLLVVELPEELNPENEKEDGEVPTEV
jgi:hypothetical protein